MSAAFTYQLLIFSEGPLQCHAFLVVHSIAGAAYVQCGFIVVVIAYFTG